MFSNKKKQATDTYYNVDGSQTLFAKWNKPDTNLHKISRKYKSKTESRSVVSRDRRWKQKLQTGMIELVSDREVPKLDFSGGCMSL